MPVNQAEMNPVAAEMRLTYVKYSRMIHNDFKDHAAFEFFKASFRTAQLRPLTFCVSQSFVVLPDFRTDGSSQDIRLIVI